MPNPFFTVITVTYNSSQFVRDALESVLASTYSDFELIIGDDCSTDNTWDIINEYSDPRIVKYRNDKNLREYPNRNKALGLARGEWIIFIDGDDVIFEHGLYIFYYYLKKFKDVKMLIQKGYTNNVIYPVIFNKHEFIRNEFFDSCRLSCSSLASNVFCRKTLVELGGLPEIYKSGDEYIRFKIGTNNDTLFISGLNTWPRETPGQAGSKITYLDSLTELISKTQNLVNLENDNVDLHELGEAIKYVLRKEIIQCILYYAKKFNFRLVFNLILNHRELIVKRKLEIGNFKFLDKFSPSNPLKS
jgi:glycosyltransferase involved in cell wall biosynthesis